jgi:hypothetical protein
MAGAGLLYIAADILGMRLYSKDKDLWGAERKDFQVGPWEFSLWLEANGQINGKECGVFVKVTKRVWLFVVLQPHNHSIVVFDAGELEKEPNELFTSRDVESVLFALGDSVKKVFEYQRGKWIAVHDAKIFAGVGK